MKLPSIYNGHPARGLATLDYWLMRTLRRNMPQFLVDFLLDHGFYIRPGTDTSQPEWMARRYVERAAAHGVAMAGATVCVVGYGGGYGVGVHLLEAGADRVILQDPFAPERVSRNRRLDPAIRERYFTMGSDGWVPDRNHIELVHSDLDAWSHDHPAVADIVVSSSVLEHVEDITSLLRGCARITRPAGVNVHYIDLRDHYFRYPFEMLCYREQTWRRWLNASNNLNRLRLPDYQRAFADAFEHCDVDVRERLPEEFARARDRIRAEFLTGDEQIDAASLIRVEARGPRH